jgi:alpha-tubulin suppressor-like RCC1 family protein
VLAGEPALDVAAGDVHSCALLRSGEVHCWGGNGRGELGDPARVDGSPGRVALSDAAKALAVGSDHTCALLQTSAASPDDAHVTTVTGLPDDVVSIACGGMLTCARTRDGSVHCWGITAADDMRAPPEKKRVRRISGT